MNDQLIAFFSIMLLLSIHYVGDFILQTDAQAKGKSTSWKSLLEHTINYSLFWFICTVFFIDLWPAILLTIITFISHTATDYVTSRLVKKYFAKGDSHMGFVIIGADQLLHYAQIFLTILYVAN